MIRLLASARTVSRYRFTDFDEVHESRVDGVIDFERRRYRTRGDNEEHIGIGAMGFTRTDRDERWIVHGNDPEAPPSPGDVLWMLDLLAGVTRVEELDSPKPDRIAYACELDLLRADERSAAGVAIPAATQCATCSTWSFGSTWTTNPGSARSVGRFARPERPSSSLNSVSWRRRSSRRQRISGCESGICSKTRRNEQH
jgi:hypothetical protein